MKTRIHPARHITVGCMRLALGWHLRLHPLAFETRKGKGRSTRYTTPKPKGPVCRNTSSVVVAAPTNKRGFVSSRFWGRVRLAPAMVTDGMGLPARMAARLRTCYEHPVHPLRFVPQTVVPLLPVGAKPMTPTQTAPSASTLAAQADPIQLHAQAVNGLRHALRLLSYGEMTGPELARAIGKATRGTTAMKRLAANLSAEG